MRTVSMKEFRGGGMNNEYAGGGRMPKQLLEYFKRKNKEYAMGGAYREYQDSGQASSSDYSRYRMFKEEGQPIQYFVKGDGGFESAGGGDELRRRLGDEGYAQVLSQFGIQPELSEKGELLSIKASPEAYSSATDAFARELAGFRTGKGRLDEPDTQYDEAFLDYLADEGTGGFSEYAAMRGFDSPDQAQKRILAEEMFEAEGLPGVGRPDKALAYRDFAKRVLGLGQGGQGQGY